MVFYKERRKLCLQNFSNLKITSGFLWNPHTFAGERINYQISAQNELGEEGEKAISTTTADALERARILLQIEDG